MAKKEEKELNDPGTDAGNGGSSSGGGGDEAGKSKGGAGGGTATKPKTRRKPSPTKKPPQPLKPWKVLLHNDDKNTRQDVVEAIVELTRSTSRKPSSAWTKPTRPASPSCSPRTRNGPSCIRNSSSPRG